MPHGEYVDVAEVPTANTLMIQWKEKCRRLDRGDEDGALRHQLVGEPKLEGRAERLEYYQLYCAEFDRLRKRCQAGEAD